MACDPIDFEIYTVIQVTQIMITALCFERKVCKHGE